MKNSLRKCEFINGWGLGEINLTIAVLLRFYFKDHFAPAKFGPDLITMPNGIPDKKACDKNEGECEKDQGNSEGR